MEGRPPSYLDCQIEDLTNMLDMTYARDAVIHQTYHVKGTPVLVQPMAGRACTVGLWTSPIWLLPTPRSRTRSSVCGCAWHQCSYFVRNACVEG
jgi:hypothetical protein